MHCPSNKDLDDDIKKISLVVSGHTGQWKMLMWGAGLIAGLMLTLGVTMYRQMDIIQATVISMDKTFTSYIQAHNIEFKNNRHRISNIELLLSKHEDRLISLEKQKVRLH